LSSVLAGRRALDLVERAAEALGQASAGGDAIGAVALAGIKRTIVAATINRLKRGGELEPFGEGVRVPFVARDGAAA
jgi:hypothetical protein